MQTEKGQSIEDESMRMIEDEVGDHGYGEMEWPVVRRVIHATADFDFASSCKIRFHPDAIHSGISALKAGRSIIVDVNGVVGGLNKQNPKDFGNDIVCRISDPAMMALAKERKKTRAQVCMRAAAKEMEGGLVVIGNAPTALLEVISMAREGVARPALIVGIPVGFVDAAYSKEQLAGSGVPFITNVGRKGGSPPASAIVNALYKLARQAP